MSTSFLLRNQLVPMESIKLGRFITDRENVLNSIHDSPNNLPTSLSQELNNINELAQHSSKPILMAKLQSLMSASLTRENSSTHHIATIKRHDLHNAKLDQLIQEGRQRSSGYLPMARRPRDEWRGRVSDHRLRNNAGPFISHHRDIH